MVAFASLAELPFVARPVDFLDADFRVAFFPGAFAAGAFPADVFLTAAFLAETFFAGDLVETAFVAADFFGAAFLAADFVVDFFVVDFLVVDFFTAAFAEVVFRAPVFFEAVFFATVFFEPALLVERLEDAVDLDAAFFAWDLLAALFFGLVALEAVLGFAAFLAVAFLAVAFFFAALVFVVDLVEPPLVAFDFVAFDFEVLLAGCFLAMFNAPSWSLTSSTTEKTVLITCAPYTNGDYLILYLKRLHQVTCWFIGRVQLQSKRLVPDHFSVLAE